MKPFRRERVASVIRDVVSAAIARRLNDPRLVPLTTVTRVEMTGDLQIARVFLSIPGGKARETRMMAAMHHATGFVQRLVASELSIRHCPELRFAIDTTIKGTAETLALLEENRRMNPSLCEPVIGDGEQHPPEERSPESAEPPATGPNGGVEE